MGTKESTGRNDITRYILIGNNATAVGMDTIALIIHKKNEKIPVAWAMYAINITVLLLGLATYGLVCVLMGIAFAGIQALSLNTFLKIRLKSPPAVVE